VKEISCKRVTSRRGGLPPYTLALVLLLLGGACSPVPENHYFTMAYSLLPGQPPARRSGTLRVRPFDIGPAYDTERIVYRHSPYEFQYYNFMKWATKPQKMITDLVVRHLRHSRVFDRVGSDFPDEAPDYELSGEILAIEELDSGDEWYAHLALNLHLTRYRSERVIWSRGIDVKKRVYNKAPVYVVKALSELLEEQMQLVVKQLAGVLGKAGEEGRRS